ncbi:MAG: hypothetical protein Q8P50_07865 [Bacillota bacterium]|nr:hypothetical protein [Bacillota bacterium]
MKRNLASVLTSALVFCAYLLCLPVPVLADDAALGRAGSGP